MPEIKHAEAKAFLDGISDSDVVAVIHDTDLDGFSSGILYYEFAKKRAREVRHFAFNYANPSIDGFELADCDKIIITDIGPGPIAKELFKLVDKKVLYVDHHQKEVEIPKEIFEYRTLEQGYIPCARTAIELTGEKEWLGMCGTIADAAYLYKENVEFIDTFLEDVEMTLEEYRSQVVNPLSNTIIFLDNNLDKAFDVIQQLQSHTGVKELLREYSKPIDEEIAYWSKRFASNKEQLGEITFFYMEPKFRVKRVLATIFCNQDHEKIFVFVSPAKPGVVSISTRNQSRKFDMIKMLEQCAGEFAFNYGGHKAAAGGTIPRDKLPLFKENLEKYVPVEA